MKTLKEIQDRCREQASMLSDRELLESVYVELMSSKILNEGSDNLRIRTSLNNRPIFPDSSNCNCGPSINSRNFQK